MNALNIYLEDKRKYLLVTLNVFLSIFIILEVMIWNDINSLMTPEEYEQARQDWCNKSQQTSTCR
ncbi:MAG TPA: hypothetical protein QF601_02230 [Dehalococcoidia bacterium]|nr:hypothetical protein [SAR202 cluster bacterium]HJN58929.1 hypothetical protein [Dehalococcoidia bacterium]